MTRAEPLAAILHVAVSCSQATRQRVAADLDGVLVGLPQREWSRIIEGRRRSVDESLQRAARGALRLASPAAKPYVRRAMAALVAAVKELAEYAPEYVRGEHVMPAAVARRFNLGETALTFPTWVPTPASVARLDGLRERVKVAFIHLEALFVEYDTPAARLLAVAKRVADVVLVPTEAKAMREWLASLEREEAAE